MPLDSDENNATSGSFFSDILKPGSSLHPTFLLVVDCAFASLFLVFVILAFLTAGNLHIFALMFIESCLWVSVKWFVNELKKVPIVESEEKFDSATESKKTI